MKKKKKRVYGDMEKRPAHSPRMPSYEESDVLADPHTIKRSEKQKQQQQKNRLANSLIPIVNKNDLLNSLFM